MRTGTACMIGGAGAVSAIDALLASHPGGFHLRGNGGFTESAAPAIDAWNIRKGLTGSFTQSTGSAKPQDVQLGSKSRHAASFLLAGSRFLKAAAPLTAASFKFLHLAAGATVFFVVDADSGTSGLVFDNKSNNASQIGFSIFANRASNNIACRVGNGSGTLVVSATLTGLGSVYGSLAVYEFTWSQAAGYSLRANGGTPTTGAAVGTPSSADPLDLPAIGALNVATASFYSGPIADILAVPGVASAQELSDVRHELATYYGISVP